MKDIILKVGREVVKIVRYLSIAGIFAMLLGIFVVFFDGQNHDGHFTLDYGYRSVQVSVWFPILVLIMTIILFYLLFRMMLSLDKLLTNFQKEAYFCSENIDFLSKVLLYQVLFTGVQLLINMSFKYFQMENVSSIFDLSFKDYLVNILLIIINDVAIVVLKRGYQLQKDHDEII
ncbi:DUF2975 domain-containing protein [Streptococcus sp. SL1232]|uniref:DUF2975 domain-containing protein n=1 Tax=Streptococcus vicugnae TaxID=2740579 RepID=UPI0018F68384|nr:DUF2975 domain-containing protein [Streptococcus vicugnae]MBJ7540595.1 DUF2975 domain-containing protein [Streptococcus vicugnae]